MSLCTYSQSRIIQNVHKLLNGRFQEKFGQYLKATKPLTFSVNKFKIDFYLLFLRSLNFGNYMKTLPFEVKFIQVWTNIFSDFSKPLF